MDFVTLEQYFPVVEVESLTMRDVFLREHVPRSRNEERIWSSCECAIRYRTRNFRRNAVSPSINKEGKIVFKKGEKPAVGKSARWWAENARLVSPKKKSRLASVYEEDLFNGMLIRYLIKESGFTVSEAWHAVCRKSARLGNFWDSPGSPHALEPTGSRKIGKYFRPIKCGNCNGGVEYKKKPIWLLFIFGVPSMGNNLRVKVPYRA